MKQLSNALIREAIAARGWPEPEAGILHVVGIRGAVPVYTSNAAEAAVTRTVQRLDEWDDTVGVFGAELHVWRATTDPGHHYTRSPLNPIGAARLEPGCYQYRRGLHQGRVPALVQAGRVLVARDTNRDGVAQPFEPRFKGWWGINIHPGRGSKIGRWSAGCQVIPEPDWAAFWATINRHPQPLYRYYLLEARDLL